MPCIAHAQATNAADTADTADAEERDWTVIPHGPLHQRNQTLFHALRGAWTPESPQLLAPGRFAVDTTLAWANHWAREPTYRWDLDTVNLDLAFRLGVTDWLEVGLQWRIGYRGAAALANLIQGFHSFFGRTEVRDTFPTDLFLLRNRETGDELTGADIGIGAGDLQLAFKFPLLQPDWFERGPNHTDALAATFLMRLPAGHHGDLWGAAGVDVGFVVNGQWTPARDRITLYGAAGLFRISQVNLLGQRPREFYGMFHLGVELRLIAEVAAHLELVIHTGIVDIGTQGEPNYELHAGGSFRFDAEWTLQFIISENTFTYANSIDLAFSLSLAWTPAVRLWTP